MVQLAACDGLRTGIHRGDQLVVHRLAMEGREGQARLVHLAGGFRLRGGIPCPPSGRVEVLRRGLGLCAARGGIHGTGGRVGHGVALARQREGRCALILGRELRVHALAAEVVGLALRKDGDALDCAVLSKGHADLDIALEALLGAHHIIGVLIQLVHRADAVGGSVGVGQGQSGARNGGAGIHQPMQTQRQYQRGRAHGGITRQPSAPQRLRRMICLLHCFTCLFLSSCTGSPCTKNSRPACCNRTERYLRHKNNMFFVS